MLDSSYILCNQTFWRNCSLLFFLSDHCSKFTFSHFASVEKHDIRLRAAWKGDGREKSVAPLKKKEERGKFEEMKESSRAVAGMVRLGQRGNDPWEC